MSDSNQNTTEHDFKSKTSPPPLPAGAAVRASSAGGHWSSARIAEQQPVMRFVDISPALRRAEPGDHHPPPLRLRGESAIELVGTQPSPKRLLGARSRSDSSLVRKWHVDHASLTRRPDDGLPPPRTARVVLATPAHVVSNRLADCLRARSIVARFSATDEHVAKCRNTGFCKFTIRLHLHASEGQGGVLVEVQRMCGDCVSFMQDCRALLNAAEGKAGGLKVEDEKPLYLRLPVSQMEFVKTASLPPTSPQEEADAVAVTAQLLASQRSDTNRLGMESLVIQTDPLKTLKSTAVLTSQLILCPNDPGNEVFNVHNYVMSLLIYGGEDHPSPFPDDSALEDHYSSLRILGLTALSNALALLAAEDMLPTALSPHGEWYASVLVVRLLRDLGAATHRPLEACYASRCLAVLAGSSADLAAKVKSAGGRDAAAHAEGVGMREFALLARDAGHCRNTLSCCV